MTPNSPQDPTQVPRPTRTRPSPTGCGPAVIATVLAGLLASIGCASGPRPHANVSVDRPTPQIESTVAAAAYAALEEVEGTPYRKGREALLAGAIVEVDGGGYSWLRPNRAQDDGRAVVRLRVDERQVATFVVHPRTGNSEVDRANEQVTRAERRLVDEIDPAHRPIFVLTPKGRILAYRHASEVVELADLRARRMARHSAASNESRVAGLER